MKQLLGIDIGTSSVKGTIIQPDGTTVAHAEATHNLSTPQPGWAEESPMDWWSNTVAVIRELLSHPDVHPTQIKGVGATGMLPALLLLDTEGTPLRPSIQQTDARAQKEIEEANLNTPPGYFFNKTGAALSQQSIGPKLQWIQRHEPDVWSRTAKVMGSYDYINHRLTGEYGVERNWALESGLYDIQKQEWSPELLALFNTQMDKLPSIHSPTDIIGAVTLDAAAETGLPAGVPVIAGAADHVGAAFAAGVMAEGDLLIKFGSAGDILYSSDTLLLDPRLYIDYHIHPGRYMLNGCMATSGSFIKWLVHEFYTLDESKHGPRVYAHLDEKAVEVPAGSEGLLILPYFLGEKTPILDPAARGVFFGMTLYHTRFHVYRAALESVVYGFRHHVEVLKQAGRTPRRVIAGGGGARSKLWRQIAADVLNQPVVYLKDNPEASLAAAFAAGKSVGAFQSWQDITRFVSVEDETTPNPGNVPVYDRCFSRYVSLYEQLKGEFRRITV